MRLLTRCAYYSASTVGPVENNCSVSEYVKGNDNLPVCFEVENKQRQKQFFFIH